MKISYNDITFNEIQMIKEVWERNRKFHEETSQHFGHLYRDLVFEDRMNSFACFRENQIKITLAQAEQEGHNRVIGYCLSTIGPKEGQMQTLHVMEEARGRGIGRELMERHLEWLKENRCENVSLVVSHENEQAIRFYENHGFRKNTLEMRLK